MARCVSSLPARSAKHRSEEHEFGHQSAFCLSASGFGASTRTNAESVEPRRAVLYVGFCYIGDDDAQMAHKRSLE